MEYLPGNKVSYRSSGGGTYEAVVATWEEFDAFHHHSDHLPGRIPLKTISGNDWIWQEDIAVITPVELIPREKDTEPEEVSFLSLCGKIDYAGFKIANPDCDLYANASFYKTFVPVNVEGKFILVPKNLIKSVKKEENPFEFIQVD